MKWIFFLDLPFIAFCLNESNDRSVYKSINWDLIWTADFANKSQNIFRRQVVVLKAENLLPTLRMVFNPFKFTVMKQHNTPLRFCMYSIWFDTDCDVKLNETVTSKTGSFELGNSCLEMPIELLGQIAGLSSQSPWPLGEREKKISRLPLSPYSASLLMWSGFFSIWQVELNRRLSPETGAMQSLRFYTAAALALNMIVIAQSSPLSYKPTGKSIVCFLVGVFCSLIAGRSWRFHPGFGQTGRKVITGSCHWSVAMDSSHWNSNGIFSLIMST